MPQNRLTISEIQAHVEKTAKNCAVCGGNQWALEPDIFRLRLNSPWSGGETKQIRCTVITCPLCGNTHFLDVDIIARLAGKTPFDEKGKAKSNSNRTESSLFGRRLSPPVPPVTEE